MRTSSAIHFTLGRTSTSWWRRFRNVSLETVRPKGKGSQRYRSYGVANVARILDSWCNSRCQKAEVKSIGQQMINDRKLITLPLQNTRVDTNTQFTRLLNSYNNLIDPVCRFVNRSNDFKTSSLWTSSLNFSRTDTGTSLAGRATGLQSRSTWRLPLPGSVPRPSSKASAYLSVRS